MKKITLLMMLILLFTVVFAAEDPVRIIAKNKPQTKEQCSAISNVASRIYCFDRWCSSFGLDKAAICSLQVFTGDVECIDGFGNLRVSGDVVEEREYCSEKEQRFTEPEVLKTYCTDRGYLGCKEVMMLQFRECKGKIAPITCEPYRTEINCLQCTSYPTQIVEDCTCTPDNCREGKMVNEVKEPWLEDGFVGPHITPEGTNQGCVDPSGKPVNQGGVERCEVNINDLEKGCGLPCSVLQNNLYCCKVGDKRGWTSEPCYDECGYPEPLPPKCEETCDYEEECIIGDYVPLPTGPVCKDVWYCSGFLCNIIPGCKIG